MPRACQFRSLSSTFKNSNDRNISNDTLCTFQIETIVKARAPMLNNKIIATGTPKTIRRALLFEIQQNTSASRGKMNGPFATNDHMVQNPPYWRASSLFPLGR